MSICPQMCVASQLQASSQQRSARSVHQVREDREESTPLREVGAVAQLRGK